MPNPELHKQKSSNKNQEQTIPKNIAVFTPDLIPHPEKKQIWRIWTNIRGICSFFKRSEYPHPPSLSTF